jgi:phage gpG-like protein
MSLQIRDTISPALAKLDAGLKDPRPVLQAMGTELVSITVRAFRDAALRAMPWPPKKDGTAARLYKSGALKQSIRITEVTINTVTVGTDRPYAAIHQLGGQTRAHIIRPKFKGALHWGGKGGPVVKSVNHPGSKIPPRPFFPFTPTGELTPAARTKIEAVARKKIFLLLKP